MFSMHHFLVGEIVLSFEEECNAPCFMHALALPPNSANEGCFDFKIVLKFFIFLSSQRTRFKY